MNLRLDLYFFLYQVVVGSSSLILRTLRHNSGLIVLSLGTFCFSVISQNWQLVIFIALFGPAYGAMMPAIPILIGDYYGTGS
ncbi:MAG: hypothetical protein QF732_09690, partial [Nitrospinaceae bacterium]|nr:hypothetical protein [Nitrospinaceae bacterium]